MKVIYRQSDTRFIVRLGKKDYALVDLEQEAAWKSKYAETWLRAGYWDEVAEQPDKDIINQINKVLASIN